MEDDLVPLEEDNHEMVEKRRFDYLSKHGSVHEALAAMQHRDGQSYSFLYNQGSDSDTRIYRCVSHNDCPKFIRLVCSIDDRGISSFALEESGTHGDVPGKRKRGIAPVLLAEADATLSGGAGPRECYLLLEARHANNPFMLALLPTEAQLKNRKAQLQKSEAGTYYGHWHAALNVLTFGLLITGGEIRHAAAIMEWANGKECETLRDFLGHDDSQPSDEPRFAPEVESVLDALVVLKIAQVGDTVI
jgi:hypothetical protein